MLGKRYSLFGIEIFSGSMSNVMALFKHWIQHQDLKYVCVTGVHGLMESKRNRKVYEAHKRADLVVPDGVPLVWVGHMNGYRNIERIYGPDLFLETFKQAEKNGWNLYLYGTTPDTLKKLNRILRLRFPNIHMVGQYAPPFRVLTFRQKEKISMKINKEKPQIVLVGLSTPKQELWMYEMRKLLTANILIGVGAAFDFIAGTKKQAPSWMRRICLEWLFRLIQEPKRLGKRYLVNNTQFLYYVFLNVFLGKEGTNTNSG